MTRQIKFLWAFIIANSSIIPIVAQTPARPITQKPRLTIPVVVIHLKPHAMEPKALSIPKGDFYLVLDNKSGARNVFVLVNRDLPNAATTNSVAAKVQDLPTKKTNLTTGSVVTLQPGNYVVTELNHPDWKTKLTVTGN